jgi:hypothetical protein
MSEHSLKDAKIQKKCEKRLHTPLDFYFLTTFFRFLFISLALSILLSLGNEIKKMLFCFAFCSLIRNFAQNLFAKYEETTIFRHYRHCPDVVPKEHR